jgi:RimJ/RimL family protein N-acetyltransferase
LELSPYHEADFPDVLRILTDARVIWWRETPLTEPEVRVIFDRTIGEQARGLGWWLLREPGGPLLGHAALKPLPNRPEWIEVAYHLLPEARGQGYATEAARALLAHGFETLNLAEIHAIVLPHNKASQAVMARLGMPRIGAHTNIGLEHDLFRLKRGEWAATR